jgi:prepilin-type processing-associated H-X9-DG protein
MNNSRQLMLAWMQYSSDNDDHLVNNYGGLFAANEERLKTYRSWVNNYMDWNATDPLGNRMDNTDGITMAPFYRNAGGLGIYKCPADNYVSPVQRSAGIAARPRSYSMNGFFGVYDPNLPTATANNFYPTYTQFLKASSIRNSSQLFVTMDEHPDSINDGFVQSNPHTDVAPSTWNDLPATYHCGACGFAFADGHAEIHKFKSTTFTILPVTYAKLSQPDLTSDPAAVQDVLWVAARASVPLQ